MLSGGQADASPTGYLSKFDRRLLGTESYSAVKSAGNRPAMLIYVPPARKLDEYPTISSIEDLWQDCGWHINVKATQCPGHAKALASGALLAGYKMILADGGDGTLGEVAGVLAFSECLLAPIPSATGNSSVKELGLPLRDL